MNTQDDDFPAVSARDDFHDDMQLGMSIIGIILVLIAVILMFSGCMTNPRYGP